ncbi:hypothetical protein G8O24_00990 [Bradyrhizobium sp. INPA01-394B]|uniref:Bacteriocin n=1 Tax=Bradyrhizobium campsiandrae TaxID=1729892 RepID=A0ABR7TZK2_9BRAD|nr:hypothetical protein [Bradyrhizobium campsiandrae]MBC9875920.1 hypothetical protein [Bradyrhizobium campsiandrae]MBC9976971.1 hypothetical protein [Bradyrhizobium campsiandrae]
MNKLDVDLLSVEDLDAVRGGMMNDGRGQLDPKAPGAYVPYGGPGMSLGQVAGELIMGSVAVGFALGL